MWLIYLLFGLFLAFNGRRSVWAVVGIVGFVTGLWLATTIWNPDSSALTWVEVVAAILVGVIGALLAQFFGRFMISAAGFMAGGYGLTALGEAGMIQTNSTWILFLIGGVIGVVLMSALFDWALIGLTAWIGAGLVINGLNQQGTSAVLVFALVFILGALSQLRNSAPEGIRKRKRNEEEK